MKKYCINENFILRIIWLWETINLKKTPKAYFL